MALRLIKGGKDPKEKKKTHVVIKGKVIELFGGLRPIMRPIRGGRGALRYNNR